MIVGLVTCYREGRLIRGCISSLARACDTVLVLEGPAPAGRELAGDASELQFRGRPDNVVVRTGAWDDDAAKRTELVVWAQALHSRRRAQPSRDPLWLVWLDGDELLLWPEYLPDYLEFLRAAPDSEENATGGFPLRHVEPDGSVYLSWGRVLNGRTVRRYLVSGYQVELDSGVIVALPLTPLCTAGGIPLAPEDGVPATDDARDLWLASSRPPLAGEPHVLHRHPLRRRGRAAQRMHDDEAAWFERTVNRGDA